jgi:hypothetical protein
MNKIKPYLLYKIFRKNNFYFLSHFSQLTKYELNLAYTNRETEPNGVISTQSDCGYMVCIK